ncbi:CDP-glycerol glycerophosphotransferase family protein [Pediococcus pentosaceus]|uniref:CDP-glycerol glycerophosphotransferase family protein n=1 Tax=Pediococcus pentosaceus TaxID=1255 RepID=UPI00315FA057
MKSLLKKNRAMALLTIYVGVFLFKIIEKFVKVRKNEVLFVSFAGKQFSDSPKVIYEHLRNNNGDLKLTWAFTDPDQFDVENKLKINSLKYFIFLAKSKYWISNASIERLLPFTSKKHVYINTWHGTPLKKLGKDDEKSDFLVKNWYENADIDYFTVSSDYDFKIFKEVFPKAKNFIKGGLPRNEILHKAESDVEFSKTVRNKVSKNLGLDENKKTILYAPTFRDTKELSEKFNHLLNDSHIKKIADEYNLLFRGHYFSENKIVDTMIDVSNYPDINELFITADALITDYSSVLFDFSILRKKIILFTPDYEQYVSERGFYMEPKNLGLPILYNLVDLVKYLESSGIEEDTKENLAFYQNYNTYPFSSINTILKIVDDN